MNDSLLNAARKLAEDAGGLSFAPPVAFVYNPLNYAWKAHETYIRRFGKAPKEAIFLGMNPGPWGMAQTGIPFGEVSLVRDWMGINVAVGKPEKEHPKRPVTGLECPRSEVSGSRLWGWARNRFGTAENFFSRFYILNYCPLSFMEESGRNRTPDKLKKNERKALFEICNRHLVKSVEILKPGFVVGIGKFAESRCREALDGSFSPETIGSVIHPSPANPRAANDWGGKIEKQLRELGVEI